MTIGIIYGGKSGEHEVSLRSAASVCKHLNPERYTQILIGISKTGAWYLQEPLEPGSVPESLHLVENEEQRVCVMPDGGLTVKGAPLHIDVAFPVVHGTFGEDGRVQGLLDIAGLPYAGAGVLGSALGMDKATVKRIWKQAGLPVVPFLTVLKAHFEEGLISEDRLHEDIIQQFGGYPVFVKPSAAGSSVGISRVLGPEELKSALFEAFRFDRKLIIEKGISGREIECSVIGNGTPDAFIPGEVVSSHTFYDYEAKYLDPNGAELVIPAPITEAQQKTVRELAVDAYALACAEGFSRVDFFLESGTEKLLLNEINTIPGFTSRSMFSMMCEVSGLPYPQVLDRLIELGLERFREENRLTYSRE